MRKIIYAQMVSLDGYIEGPKGELKWSAPGEELHKHFNDLYLKGEIDTSLYGRKLYEIMAGYWPFVKEDDDVAEVEKEFAQVWKKVPKIVFSKTLKDSGWNSKLANKVIPEEIEHLKQQQGSMIEIGGANLAATFFRLGLINQVWMYIHPVILGGGKSLFPKDLNLSLSLIDSQTFSCGVVRLRYDVLQESEGIKL